MYNEFEYINKFLTKYAKDFSGARNLKDDAAVFLPPYNEEMVISTDTYISGVHGPTSLNPTDAARRAILIASSDLAAMAADPLCVFIAINLPKNATKNYLENLATGIGLGLKDTRLALAGGNISVYEGNLSLNVTVVGSVPKGLAIGRKGARPGDLLVISGCIGDGYLGLNLLQGEFKDIKKEYKDTLITNFLQPVPRLNIAIELRGIASAMIDTSDGLIADVEHICEASNCSLHIDSSLLPFSPAALDLLAKGKLNKNDLLLSGDDYELAFSLPRNKLSLIDKISSEKGYTLSLIGNFSNGSGVFMDKKSISGGYKHF